MLTLRKKISRPLLLLIISIPIAIMLLFNISISHFAKVQAQRDLTYVANNIPNGVNQDDFMRVFPFVRSQLGSSTVEVVIYNKLGLPAKFLNNINSFVTEDIAKTAYETLENLPLGEIASFSIDGDDYYIIEVQYTGRAIYEKVAYISKSLYLGDFLATVNLILLLISIFITVLAIFISSRLSKSIARPIEHITHSLENIDANELLTIETTSDTIEIHKLTNEFNAMNKRIFQAHNSQKSFLNNASHELRTPLMNIQGYADGIAMGVFEDAKGTSQLISQQSKRLTTIVDSLLTLARAENFDTSTQLKQVNISNSLLEILNEYKGYAVKNNIELKTDIIPNIYAQANDELLIGALGNIVSNAIRYASKTVFITLENKENKALITIKDDGKGIDNIDKIYEKFSKGKDGNFGLGLSIAKTSVEMMNASINAYNDGGAVFEIELTTIKTSS